MPRARQLNIDRIVTDYMTAAVAGDDAGMRAAVKPLQTLHDWAKVVGVLSALAVNFVTALAVDTDGRPEDVLALFLGDVPPSRNGESDR
jgi:hypothetical protein